MSEYVVVGGRRKNPAIEKMNFPQVSAEKRAAMILSEMKAIAFGPAKTPDIPISFSKGRE